MSDLLHPLSLSLLFLFFTSMAAQSTEYPNCPAYTCGGLHITYPFWKIGNETATQFCGYQRFGINCSADNIPSIHLGRDLYYVKNIIDGKIVLIDYDVQFPVVTRQRECPRVRHGIYLETLPLNFSWGNVNLSFHFNCTGLPPFARPIQCLDYRTKKSCVNRLNSEPENFDWDPFSCEEEVVTTVFDWNLPGTNPIGMEYLQALSEGFELSWQMVSNCSKCENSNGRCGYNCNTTELMCFCQDGTATDHCKKGRSKIGDKSPNSMGFNHKSIVGRISRC